MQDISALIVGWMCRGISNEDDGMPAKVIVFSQWTRMLDLIQSALHVSNIRFSRLDGTMGVSARAHAVAHFTVRVHLDVSCYVPRTNSDSLLAK